MLSFKPLALVFTLAAAAFTSAAPMAAPVAGLAVRTDAPAPLPDVLHKCHDDLSPLVANLHTVVAANATIEVVGPILDDVKVVLHTAIDAVVALKGQVHVTVFGCAEGSLDLSALVGLIGGVLRLVFEVLGYLLGVIGHVKTHVLFPLLCEVGALVGELLNVIIDLVGGLLGGLVATLIKILVGLIGAIVNVILELDVKVCISVLGL